LLVPRIRPWKIACSVLLAIVFTLVWGFYIEPGLLVTRHVRLELPRWNADLRIAVLSDLHTGSPGNGLDKLPRIVDRTQAENPAMVVLLGDFVTGGPFGRHEDTFVEPERIATELRRMRAPLGVFAVLGNHDWWFDGERVERALRSAGITVLENRPIRVPRPSGAFWVGGIADLWTRSPNVEATLEQVSGGDPVILITHNPDIFPDVPPRVNLTIAAHTHGGQVSLPFFGPVVTTSRQGYVAGHYSEGARHLFVTTGIGTSIIGVRFRVPPEVVMLTVTQEKRGNGP
jgi:predicted MPP superfamily phosphohydrolase